MDDADLFNSKDEAFIKSQLINTLFNITRDAIFIFDDLGIVLFTNEEAKNLLRTTNNLVGSYIKDIFLRYDGRRASKGMWPFPTDGTGVTITCRPSDGSLIPVEVHAEQVNFENQSIYLLASRDANLVRETMRERDRLVRELRRSNTRLRASLSIISATLGSYDYDEVLNRILNALTQVLDSDASLIYFLTDKGYELQGSSNSIYERNIPKTTPLGFGVLGLIENERKITPFRFLDFSGGKNNKVTALNLNSYETTDVNTVLSEKFSTVLGVPIFSGNTIISIIILGWTRPYAIRRDDLNLLETVADYLSIEVASAIAGLRKNKIEGLERAKLDITNMFFEAKEITPQLIFTAANRVREEVFFRYVPIVVDEDGKGHIFLAEDGIKNQNEILLEKNLSKKILNLPVLADLKAVEGLNDWVLTHLGEYKGVVIHLPIRIKGYKSISFLALRHKNEADFTINEKAFFKKVLTSLQKALRGDRERKADFKISQALQKSLKSNLDEIKGVESSGLYSSATAHSLLGGDFFGTSQIADGKGLIYIGDISGKGIQAASMSTFVRTTLEAYAWIEQDPSAIIDSLNKLFFNSSKLETFATVFLAIVDLKTGEAQYCSAGHTPAIFINQKEDFNSVQFLKAQSPIVGGIENAHYINGSFNFMENDGLFLYTDGVTEARSPENEFYGEARLLQDVSKFLIHDTTSKLPENILNRIVEFTQEDLTDDIAMVSVKFLNPKKA